MDLGLKTTGKKILGAAVIVWAIGAGQCVNSMTRLEAQSVKSAYETVTAVDPNDPSKINTEYAALNFHIPGLPESDQPGLSAIIDLRNIDGIDWYGPARFDRGIAIDIIRSRREPARTYVFATPEALRRIDQNPEWENRIEAEGLPLRLYKERTCVVQPGSTQEAHMHGKNYTDANGVIKLGRFSSLLPEEAPPKEIYIPPTFLSDEDRIFGL